MAQNIDILISAKDTASKQIASVKSSIVDLKWSINQLWGIAWWVVSGLKTWFIAVWASLTALWAIGIKSSASMEQTNIAFKTLYGSAEEANKVLNNLADFAAKTPFEFPELADAARKLQSVWWVARDDLIPTLTSLGDIASSQWKNIDMIAEAFNDAVVWEFERLKEFGIRASQEWDKVTFTYKWQTTVVQKNNEAIADYITKLWQAQWVAGSMDSQSNTLNWRISTMKDNFNFLTMEILWVTKSWEVMKWGFFDKISNALNSLWSLFEQYRPQIMSFFKSIWEVSWEVATIASEFWKEFWNDIKELWATIKDVFAWKWPIALQFFLESLKATFALIGIAIKWLNIIFKWEFFDVMYTWFQEFSDWFSILWQNIKNSITWIVDSLVSYITGKFDSMISYVSEKIEWLKNKAQEAKDFIASITSSANKASQSFVKNFSIQWVSEAISWARASWWPVNNGKTYLVWEKWPELFVPKTNGSIIPNRWLSPNININFWNLNVQNRSDADYLADKIKNTLIRELQLSKLGIS